MQPCQGKNGCAHVEPAVETITTFVGPAVTRRLGHVVNVAMPTSVNSDSVGCVEFAKVLDQQDLQPQLNKAKASYKCQCD